MSRSTRLEHVDRNPFRTIVSSFLLFGAWMGSMAIAVVELENAMHISHAAFGGLLTIGMIGAAGANAVISVLAHRHGELIVMRWALTAWAAFLCLGAVVEQPAMLAMVFVATVTAGGAADVVMNTMAAARSTARPERLLRIHALFNIGAAAGALAAGVLLGTGASWRWIWITLALTSAVMAFDARPNRSAPPQVGGEHVPLSASLRALWTERLLLVVAAFMLGAIVEGGIDTWGPVFLRTDLGSGVTVGAGAAATGYVFGCIGRLSLGYVTRHVGTKRTILIGASEASLGVFLLATAEEPIQGSIGLVLAVMGISANWPLLTSLATSGSGNPTLISGGLTSAGYAGMVAGPALLGAIADFIGLRQTMGLICAGATTVFFLATRLSDPAMRPAQR